MAVYEGHIERYSINIDSRNNRRVRLIGTFGGAKEAYLNFVADLEKYKNTVRSKTVEVYFVMESWDTIINILRHYERPFFSYSNGVASIVSVNQRELG